MPPEIEPAILRMEIDQLSRELHKLEVLHRTDNADVKQLITAKHQSVADALTAIRAGVSRLETQMAIVYGDPEKSDDKGAIDRLQASVTRLWKKTDKATDERWKIRLTIAGTSLTTTGAAFGLAKLLGF